MPECYMVTTDIKITLTSGQKYKLRLPETLSEIDKNQTAIFLFDNMKVYEGKSDGEVDEDGYFAIFKPNKNFGAAMPYNRLVGWAYKRGGNA